MIGKKICALIVVLIAFVFISCNSRKDVSAGKPIKVTLGNIMNYIKSSGMVQSRQQLQIKSSLSATINKILVKEGENVKKGQVLLDFDAASTDLELNVSETEAAYNLAVINKKSAERTLAVSRELYKIRAESLLELKSKEEALAKADHELHRSKKELAYAKLQRQKLKCVSPIGGTVVTKAVEENMMVTVGQPLVEVADTKNIEIIVDIDEVDIGRVFIGELVVITLDAYPDQKLYGCIGEIASQAKLKQARAIIEAKVTLDNPSDILKINTHVDVSIITEKKESVLMLPLSAVNQDAEAPFVWIKNQRNGKLEKHDIVTGLSDFHSVEVVSGLKKDDLVYVMLSERRN